MAITFPISPESGQEFVGENGATYLYTGDRWSSIVAITQGLATFIAEGNDAAAIYNELFDNTIDGGGA